MASPWEKYGTPQAQPQAQPEQKGPWAKYGTASDEADVDYFFDKDKTISERIVHGLTNAVQTADDLGTLFARGASAGGIDVLFGQMPGRTVEGEQAATAAARERHPTAGAIAEMVGAAAPSLALPGSATATLPRAVATGGLMAGGQQAATHYFDTGEMPDATSLATNVALGGLFGAAGHGLGRLFQQPKMDMPIRKNMELLQQEGIDVTSGQITKNLGMLAREAKAPGAQEFVEKQAQSFSKAALRKAGLMADDGRLNPQMLEDGFEFVGRQMDDLALRHNIGGPEGRTVLPDLLAKARLIAAKYKNSVEGGEAKIISNTVRDIAKAAKSNTLTGAKYQEIASALESAARSNPRLAGTARQMRGAVNEAMNDYIAKTNPAEAELWKMANRRWANLLVIEDAYTRAGRDAAEGIITPSALGMATRAIRGKKLYAKGKTDFDELARAGQTLLRPLPVSASANSDEIARILARRVIRAGVGGTAGFAVGGGIPGAVAGAVAPEVLSALGGRIALAPAASLSRTAASTGGSYGTMLGAAAASQNPFSRAINE